MSEEKAKRYLSGVEIQDLLSRKNTPQERPPRQHEEEPDRSEPSSQEVERASTL